MRNKVGALNGALTWERGVGGGTGDGEGGCEGCGIDEVECCWSGDCDERLSRLTFVTRMRSFLVTWS